MLKLIYQLTSLLRFSKTINATSYSRQYEGYPLLENNTSVGRIAPSTMNVRVEESGQKCMACLRNAGEDGVLQLHLSGRKYSTIILYRITCTASPGSSVSVKSAYISPHLVDRCRLCSMLQYSLFKSPYILPSYSIYSNFQ